MDLQPVILERDPIRLAPMSDDHVSGLWEATLDTEVWTYMPFSIESEKQMAAFVSRAIGLASKQLGLGFTIIERQSGDVIGSTGYWNVEHAHARLEIGASWITRRFQRTK